MLTINFVKIFEVNTSFQTNKGLIMSKVILNLDLAKTDNSWTLQNQGVSDFVLDLKHVVGLINSESYSGSYTEVSFKVGDLPVTKVCVTNDFDDIANDLIAFNPDFFVATTENLITSDICGCVGNKTPINIQLTCLLWKRFLVNSKRLVGVAKVNGKTEITLKAPIGSERKVYYVDLSKAPKNVDVNAYVKLAVDNAKTDASHFWKKFGFPVAGSATIETKPTKFIIEEDFDEIASLVVYGAFDPELD